MEWSNHSKVPADARATHGREALYLGRGGIQGSSCRLDRRHRGPGRRHAGKRAGGAHSLPHKHKKDIIGGKFLTCRNCKELFTPNDMINMALDCHLASYDQTEFSLPFHDKRIELSCYRYPYDYNCMTTSDDGSNFGMIMI